MKNEMEAGTSCVGAYRCRFMVWELGVSLAVRELPVLGGTWVSCMITPKPEQTKRYERFFQFCTITSSQSHQHTRSFVCKFLT